MGKKGGAKAAKPVEVTSEVRKQVDALRNVASQQYLKKEYSGALDAFDKAYQLLPENCAERSDLLQKKAFCYMNLKKYKEAIKEAGTILETTPDSLTARKTRIKALEHLGQAKQALIEVQAVNREQPSDETREMEKRLQAAVAGRPLQPQRPSSTPAASPSSSNQRAQAPFQLTIKATLDNESKLVSTPLTVSYYELLNAVKAKYPDAGPFRLQYRDKDGDNITVTSRQDIQTALSELIIAFQKQHGGQHAPRLLQQNGLPPLKLQVIPVEKQSQVPKPPLDELFPRKDAGNEPVYEPEEWLLEFARLFSEVTGLDTHTPLEHQNLGADKLQQAMSDTLANEEAGPLFDQAGEHFRDAAVVSMIQWGNVFIVKADRLLQSLTKAGKPIKGKELATIMALYDETQKKIEEGLRIKPDSWEAVGSLAQLEWERAKAKLGYVMPLPPAEEAAPDAPNKSPEQQATDSQAVVLKQLMQILSKVNEQDVVQVGPHIKACNAKFEEALVLAKKQHEAAEATKAAKLREVVNKQGKDAAKPAEDPALPLFSTPPANVLVMHGNILYDWSQVLAETKAEPWRPVLDKATEKFKASGAPEQDIRAALKNHSRKDELDLGPDPEPPAPAAKPPTPAPTSEKKEKAPAPEAKGLPSLAPKPRAQDGDKKKSGGGPQQNTTATNK